MMRHTEPPGGGSRESGVSSVSRTPAMRAGVESVTQMRVDEKPGRAGSVRTSGDGPSAIAVEAPSALSTVTMRRTGFGLSILFPEARAHHHECHSARRGAVGPAVPVAELHHHVAGIHDALAVVELQDALAFEQDAVVERFRLVVGRAEVVLAALVPGAAGMDLPGRVVARNRALVRRRVVVRRLSGRLHD